DGRAKALPWCRCLVCRGTTPPRSDRESVRSRCCPCSEVQAGELPPLLPPHSGTEIPNHLPRHKTESDRPEPRSLPGIPCDPPEFGENALPPLCATQRIQTTRLVDP